MILLIGQNGVLSKAIQNKFENAELHIVGSEIAKKWFLSKSGPGIESYIESLGCQPKLILNASGIINPQSEYSDLIGVNFHLPRALYIFAQKHEIKLVTFGTIMENLNDIAISNPYILSKKKYFEYVQEVNAQNSNSLHLQFHTWYGGASLQKFMFLGQMFAAIDKGRFFHMSQGTQLREYHHISDDLNVLSHLLNINARGVFQINHGESVTLKSLAEKVFSEFKVSQLLRLGTLPQPEVDNYQTMFSSSTLLGDQKFRETVPGIIEYFKFLMGESK